MRKKTDTLGDKIKSYENVSKTHLDDGYPVIIRVDGKAFHTYLRHVLPFTVGVNEAMNDAAIALCKQIQDVQFAYVQSDEISLFLHGYKHELSEHWFDNQVQKMCSVSASIAASVFSLNSWKIWGYAAIGPHNEAFMPVCKPASFDSRVFTLPEEELCNYFIWRQQDAMKNSVSALARTFYSQKQVNGKKQSDLKEMCEAKGKKWDDLALELQRGRCVYRMPQKVSPEVIRNKWSVDNNIPIFAKERNFVERFLRVGDDNDADQEAT